MEYQFIDSNRFYIFSVAEPNDIYRSDITAHNTDTDAEDNHDTKGANNTTGQTVWLQSRND